MVSCWSGAEWLPGITCSEGVFKEPSWGRRWGVGRVTLLEPAFVKDVAQSQYSGSAAGLRWLSGRTANLNNEPPIVLFAAAVANDKLNRRSECGAIFPEHPLTCSPPLSLVLRSTATHTVHAFKGSIGQYTPS
jgi:hypothetical protein